ncbi:MAG: hypothetical protein KF851_12155 [Pirellulaceae bacterium]|nr:hypothetical protein [Pirellulaceae bacterium]
MSTEPNKLGSNVRRYVGCGFRIQAGRRTGWQNCGEHVMTSVVTAKPLVLTTSTPPSPFAQTVLRDNRCDQSS